MGLFEDEKYNNMDWLEAACQPIIDPINEILAKIPDKIEIKKEDIISRRIVTYTNITSIVSRYTDPLSSNDMSTVCSCFEFVLEGDSLTYNSETDELMGNGQIYLVKTRPFFSERETEKRIGKNGVNIVDRISYRDVDKDCINEMLEVLELEEARRSRSIKTKLHSLKKEFFNIMEENRWNIRDIPLSNRVGIWIEEYICRRNMGALANFCKLKAMTHNNQPIYSIKDEEAI